MIFTIIPAKPFSQSKTRLSSTLTPAQRISLSRNLFLRTITVAQTIGPVVVVSRSQAARRLAKALNAWALVEGEPNLNAAIQQGLEWATLKGAEAALIIPIDLPLLTSADLQAMIAPAQDCHPAAIIAPCRRNQGTNALFLRPPKLITPQFGPNSFARHQAAAQKAGVTPLIYRSAGLALDLDTPEDWRLLEQTEPALWPRHKIDPA